MSPNDPGPILTKLSPKLRTAQLANCNCRPTVGKNVHELWRVAKSLQDTLLASSARPIQSAAARGPKQRMARRCDTVSTSAAADFLARRNNRTLGPRDQAFAQEVVFQARAAGSTRVRALNLSTATAMPGMNLSPEFAMGAKFATQVFARSMLINSRPRGRTPRARHWRQAC